MKLASPTSTIGRASQRLMELEVDALMGTGYGEKSGARLAKRYAQCAARPRISSLNSAGNSA